VLKLNLPNPLCYRCCVENEDFKKHAKVLENEKGSKIFSLKSDHGGEFENEKFEHFCENMV